jgi:hypothetical protein
LRRNNALRPSPTKIMASWGIASLFTSHSSSRARAAFAAVGACTINARDGFSALTPINSRKSEGTAAYSSAVV